MTLAKTSRWITGPVDRRARRLVDGLNAAGIFQTVYSCAGHVTRKETPYILFQAALTPARQLATWLNTSPVELRFCWTVEPILGPRLGGTWWHLYAVGIRDNRKWKDRRVGRDLDRIEAWVRKQFITPFDGTRDT